MDRACKTDLSKMTIAHLFGYPMSQNSPKTVRPFFHYPKTPNFTSTPFKKYMLNKARRPQEWHPGEKTQESSSIMSVYRGPCRTDPPPPDPQHHGYCAMSNTLVLIGPIVR